MEVSFTGAGDPRAFGIGKSGGGGDFSKSLAAALGGGENRVERDPREAAEELVAITLIQPVLAKLRESEMGAEPFAPSDGEKRFGALYDAEIARRMVKSRSFPLVDALARQMRERQASAGVSASVATEGANDDAGRDGARGVERVA